MDIMKKENTTEEERIIKPESVEDLLLERKPCQITKLRKISFSGLKEHESVKRLSEPIADTSSIAAQIVEVSSDWYDYNESEPFVVGGRKVMASRREPHELEISHIRFSTFEDETATCSPLENINELPGYQDPRYLGLVNGCQLMSFINTELKENGELAYWSEVMEIKDDDLNNLVLVAKTPHNIKGVCLIDSPGGGIYGFERPDGGVFGLGKVCFFRTDNLSKLNEIVQKPEEMQVIDLFQDDEWGGLNDMHYLPDGRLQVLGHIARLVETPEGIKKEYFVTTGIFDTETKSMSKWQIILTKEDLGVKVDPKRPELDNLVYPTNFVIDGEKLHIYISVSDAEPFVVTIENPCLK